MIFSATFSKPAKNVQEVLGKPYIKIRFWRSSGAGLSAAQGYDAEFFTEKQAFRKHFSDQEFEKFLAENAGTTFRNVVERSENEEITVMANRHGEVKTLRRPLKSDAAELRNIAEKSQNRSKKYILPEGTPVPFLVRLGVMTRTGAVVSQKYDKFRQINRFLEYIRDILPQVLRLNGGEFTRERPLRICDFGSGKSYLTFAVHYYLTEIEKIPVEIFGLDLKADVIADCQKLARELDCSGLDFAVGDIARYSGVNPDIVITLHACDTATDFALEYAVSHGAKAVLSVPCCQHELNLQMNRGAGSAKQGGAVEGCGTAKQGGAVEGCGTTKQAGAVEDCSTAKQPGVFENHGTADGDPFAVFRRYGIIQERFAALATDAIRAQLLEEQGYSVQVLEFIDMSHTPKNLLLRAVKKSPQSPKEVADAERLAHEAGLRVDALLARLGVRQTLSGLFAE